MTSAQWIRWLSSFAFQNGWRGAFGELSYPFVEGTDAGGRASSNRAGRGGLGTSTRPTFVRPGSQFSTLQEQSLRSASWDTFLRMGPGPRAQSHICCLEGAISGWAGEEGTGESPG